VNIEKMIMEAITGETDKETAMCRISCNAAASRAMFCSCGTCLDQTTTVVVTINTPRRRQVLAYCSRCWESMEGDVVTAANDTGTPILVEGWNGVLLKQGETETDVDA